MIKLKICSKILFSGIILIFILGIPLIILASESNGTIDYNHKYAWSERAGWINFRCNNCNVHITDSSVTGYAWSDNYGWINLNPTNGGITNDGEGNLSGYAWGDNFGWINFDNVSINGSGKFVGTASGTISGIISFDCDNCDVQTDWRPRSIRTKYMHHFIPPQFSPLQVSSFKKEIISKIPPEEKIVTPVKKFFKRIISPLKKIPSEEETIVSPTKKVFRENISLHQRISSQKEKNGSLLFFKKYGGLIRRKIANFWQKIINSLRKIWPF